MHATSNCPEAWQSHACSTIEAETRQKLADPDGENAAKLLDVSDSVDLDDLVDLEDVDVEEAVGS